MSISAPLAVVVEVRANDRRVFRLSRAVSETGVVLERPAPFEVGQPVTATFVIPGSPAVTMALPAIVNLTDDDDDGSRGGRALVFRGPRRDDLSSIGHYVKDRLALPAL